MDNFGNYCQAWNFWPKTEVHQLRQFWFIDLYFVGVFVFLTLCNKPLTNLYRFVRKHLGDNRPEVAELEALRAELEEANLRIHSLEDEKRILQERLSKYEPVEELVDTEAAAEQELELPEGTAPEGGAPTGEAAPSQEQTNAEV